MKLLMFDTNEFWYRTFSKTLEQVETTDKEEKIENALVIFTSVEKEDEERKDKVVKKAIDNISWLARKTSRNRIVLHSFAHLSDNKSSIEFAKETLEAIKEKLNSKGLETSLTPFGYFLEFKIHVRGESLAKVWKSV